MAGIEMRESTPARRRRRPVPHRRHRERQRRRAILRWGLLGAILALALAGAATFRVYQIGHDLLVARDRFDTVERLLKAGKPTAARVVLADGAARVTHANNVVYTSPELSILNLVPVARQNIQSLRRSVSIALRLSASGGRLMDTAQPLVAADGHFEVPMRSGALPLPVINALRPQLRELEGALPLAGDAPNSRALLPPVRSLERAIYRQAGLRKTQTATLAAGLDVLAALSGAGGPRRFLIAVANAAEMRGTGGMILAYGQLTSADGKFSLDHFGGIDELRLKEPVPTPPGTPADYLQHYNDLAPTLEWRNANLGGDFTFTGPVLEAMFAKATGRTVDGVIQMDSMGLAALMKGTGPVEVAGLGTVTADNVVRVTLSDAYNRFPTERGQRQEVVGTVAEAVFKKLVTGDYASLRPLASALVDAAVERRVMLHMAAATDQRQVGGIAVDGRLPPDGPDLGMLSVQNFAANKLDYLLDTRVRLTGERRPGALGHVQAEITIDNRAPVGQTTPAYVFGPFNRALKAGQYVGSVALYMSTGTSLVSARGDLGEGPVGVSTEAGRSVISFPLRLDAGGHLRVVLDLQLPPGPGAGYGLVLIPVSRVRPTTYEVRLDRGRGRRRIQFSGALVQPVLLADKPS